MTTSPSDTVSIPAAIESLVGPWQPADLATFNDAIIRLARLHGTFEWHRHVDDEAICWDGRFRIELEGRAAVDLAPGDPS